MTSLSREVDPATCDDGSEFFMTPEWIFYLAVLAHEAAHGVDDEPA